MESKLRWLRKTAKQILCALREFLQSQTEDFWTWGNRPNMEQAIKAWIAENAWQNGEVLWPARVALSGQEKSPSPFELLETYGKSMSLQRLDAAIASL